MYEANDGIIGGCRIICSARIRAEPANEQHRSTDLDGYGSADFDDRDIDTDHNENDTCPRNGAQRCSSRTPAPSPHGSLRLSGAPSQGAGASPHDDQEDHNGDYSELICETVQAKGPAEALAGPKLQ